MENSGDGVPGQAGYQRKSPGNPACRSEMLCYNGIAVVRELVEEFFRDLKQLSVGDPETIRGQNRPIRGQKSTI